jgi:hypothetical protein
MVNHKPAVIGVFFCLCLSVSFFALNYLYAENINPPAQSGSAPFVSKSVTPGLSPEVRQLSVKKRRLAEDPVREFSRRPGGYAETVIETGPRTKDPLVREPDGRSPSRTPSPDLSFEGMSLQNGGDGLPPDTIGDVGPNHYVQMVNTAFAIFDKNGNILSGPTDINQLWQGQGNPCETYNDGDPVVLYDPLADRWLLSQFMSHGVPHECIAISQTPDPTGAYYLYAFEIPFDFDYPKLAVWPDAYYMSANEFGFTGSYVGAYAFDRSKMLLGQPATYQKFESTSNFMLPSDLDGSITPPSGTPNYFYTMIAVRLLEIWEFHVDFENPSNSVFTFAQTVTTSPYNYGVCNFSWECIPQPETQQKLDVISEWPMWRLQYRNFGTHETLVGNFTVDVADFENHAGIRWFELRKTGDGSWSVYQEGTHAPDAHHRWMGSIAMDGHGNTALGYSVSSENLYPSIRYASRLATDATGTLQGEVTLMAGAASQTNSNRWGDYSSMSVDPSDDATFWYTNEYLTDSADGWRTRIGRFTVQPFLYVSKDGVCGGKTPCETSIQTAVETAPTGAIIKIAQGTYDEPIVLNESKRLTLQGGWDSSFTTQTTNTTFIKTPIVTAGSLTLQMVSIRTDIYVSKDGVCGGKTPCETSIQTAVSTAATGTVIRIAQGTYDEPIVLNESKRLTLQGGWDSSFTTQTANTTFIKAPIVTAGSLTFQMVTIQGQ